MPPLSSSKREAVAALKRGEAVIFPTETVYGLGEMCIRDSSQGFAA